MKRRNIEIFYNEYCTALTWAEFKVKKLHRLSRSYIYKGVLEKELNRFKSGIKSSVREVKDIPLLLDATTGANILINISKKFEDRTEPEFIDRLRKSLYGPALTHGEIVGKSSTSRNIQSELLFASKTKYPSTAIFSRGDIEYDMRKFKIGVECKRIHSIEKIEKLFDEACLQIETNQDISCGYVAIRLDKYFYGDIFPKPVLFEKKDRCFRVPSEQKLNELFEFQTHSFVEEFEEKFRMRILNMY